MQRAGDGGEQRLIGAARPNPCGGRRGGNGRTDGRHNNGKSAPEAPKQSERQGAFPHLGSKRSVNLVLNSSSSTGQPSPKQLNLPRFSYTKNTELGVEAVSILLLEDDQQQTPRSFASASPPGAGTEPSSPRTPSPCRSRSGPAALTGLEPAGQAQKRHVTAGGDRTPPPGVRAGSDYLVNLWEGPLFSPAPPRCQRRSVHLTSSPRRADIKENVHWHAADVALTTAQSAGSLSNAGRAPWVRGSSARGLHGRGLPCPAAGTTPFASQSQTALSWFAALKEAFSSQGLVRSSELSARRAGQPVGRACASPVVSRPPQKLRNVSILWE